MEEKEYPKGFGLEHAFHRAILEGERMHVSKLLQHVDLSRFDAEINLKYKFLPSAMIKLIIFKKLKGIEFTTQLVNYLKSNQKDARRLGFLRGENNKVMVPDRRTIDLFERDMNEETKALIFNIVETVRYNIEKNCLLTDMDFDKPKSFGKSARTEYRKREKKFKYLCKFVKKQIYPHIKMYIEKNAIFDKNQFLDMIVHCAINRDFTHNGSLTLKERSSERTPSSDALLHHLRKFESINEVQAMFRDAFDITNNIMKANGLFEHKIDVAIDYTTQMYYGDKNDHMLLGVKPDRGASHGYVYASINIVVTGKRITLLCLPVRFGDNKEDIVRELVTYAQNWVRINRVFADRGFYSTHVIEVLQKLGVYFVIPAVRHKKIKKLLDHAKKVKNLEHWFGDDKQEFALYPDTSIVPYVMCSGKKQVRFKLVVMDSKKRDGEKFAFATNMIVNRNNAKIVAHLYDKRWGIETSYRVGHDFLARTTSKNYLIRLFYFQFSMILYNCWVIVNALLGLAMFDHVPQKPIVSAKLFGTVLYVVIRNDT